MKPMNLCVTGTGYVGLVTGTCLAEIGHRVVCLDNDESKIQTLNAGKMPIFEPHLEDLVRGNRQKGRLSFTTDFGVAFRDAEGVFICVGTPPLENGDADLSAVEKVVREIASRSKSYKLVIEKSTVPVQTGEYISRTLQMYCRGKKDLFDVASNPEFLREGSAVYDFFHPDRIVVGVDNERTEKMLRGVYWPILERDFSCPVHSACPSSSPPAFLVTDVKSAELIKHASNSFLATKISFINAIADLCEKVGADVEKVAQGMGLDMRIGKDFLRAGLGFGGFCFPKDLQAFVRIAEKNGYDFLLLREVERINRGRVEVALEKLKKELWVLQGKTIGVLGLAFKPQTDDTRFAPALELIRRLLKEGVKVRAYDPEAAEKTREEFADIFYAQNAYQAAEGTEAVILATEWPEFRQLDWERVRQGMIHPYIFDGRNFLDPVHLRSLGFRYEGMGRLE